MVNVKSIEVGPSKITLIPGKSVYLGASVSPVNATNKGVYWYSDNQNVATVNPKSGLVVAKNYGNVKIYARSKENNAIYDYCELTVAETVSIERVYVYPNITQMTVGETNTLHFSIYPSFATNQTLVWSSSNSNVVEVGRTTGKLVAKLAGQARIMVKTMDGTIKHTTVINVTNVLSGVDLYINDQSIIDTIIASKNLCDTVYDMYLSGEITETHMKKVQEEAKYAADLARADYIVTNDQSDFAYQYFKGRNYKNGDVSPFSRTIEYNPSKLMTGLDIMIIQRGMQALELFEPDETYRFGTYDNDTYMAALNGNLLLGTKFEEGAYRVLFNSTNKSQRTPTWLLELQKYSEQHKITQCAVAARALAKIEVTIKGGGPSGFYAGRADVLRDRGGFSEIWEVKHKNVRNLQLGNSQLERYTQAGSSSSITQSFSQPLLRGYSFEKFYYPYSPKTCLEITSPSEVKGLVFYNEVPIPSEEPIYVVDPFPEAEKEYQYQLKPITVPQEVTNVAIIGLMIVIVAGCIYFLGASGALLPIAEALRGMGDKLVPA